MGKVTLSDMSYALDDALVLLEEMLPADHAGLIRLQDQLARVNVQMLDDPAELARWMKMPPVVGG